MDCRLLALVALAAAARPAAADPLGDLVAAARRHHLPLREQALRVEEAEARARLERAARYPRLDLQAGYRRNAAAIRLPLAGGDLRTLVPLDQLDGELALTVPLYDAATSTLVVAADAEADARRAEAAATEVEVE